MGGNVVMLYAGVRPRASAGWSTWKASACRPPGPAQAPGRYAKWMDEIKALHRGELALKAYDDAAAWPAA
jgi:hypothetical protein